MTLLTWLRCYFNQYLIENGSEVDKLDHEDTTPLALAARTNGVNSVRLLIQRGANVNRANKSSQTPLMSAAYTGNLDCIKLLVEEGKADIDLKSNDNLNALAYSVVENRLDIFEYLLAKSTPSEEDLETCLQMVLRYKDTKTTEFVLSKVKSAGLVEKAALLYSEYLFGEGVLIAMAHPEGEKLKTNQILLARLLLMGHTKEVIELLDKVDFSTVDLCFLKSLAQVDITCLENTLNLVNSESLLIDHPKPSNKRIPLIPCDERKQLEQKITELDKKDLIFIIVSNYEASTLFSKYPFLLELAYKTSLLESTLYYSFLAQESPSLFASFFEILKNSSPFLLNSVVRKFFALEENYTAIDELTVNDKSDQIAEYLKILKGYDSSIKYSVASFDVYTELKPNLDKESFTESLLQSEEEKQAYFKAFMGEEANLIASEIHKLMETDKIAPLFDLSKEYIPH